MLGGRVGPVTVCESEVVPRCAGAADRRAVGPSKAATRQDARSLRPGRTVFRSVGPNSRSAHDLAHAECFPTPGSRPRGPLSTGGVVLGGACAISHTRRPVRRRGRAPDGTLPATLCDSDSGESPRERVVAIRRSSVGFASSSPRPHGRARTTRRIRPPHRDGTPVGGPAVMRVLVGVRCSMRCVLRQG
jgi:hypothetical protein